MKFLHGNSVSHWRGARRLRLSFALACVSAVLIGACARNTASPSGDVPSDLSATAGQPLAVVRVMLVNDVYVIDTMRDGRGGLARVAALRDSIERATHSRVLMVLAGDFLSPSLLGKWYGGAQMVDGFNAARLDYATVGNHEFDASRANLVARVQQSTFRWLTGNCRERTGAPFPGMRGWDTVTVNGTTVGIFGSTVVRDYPSYVQCGDADSATHAMVDTLTKMKVPLIIGVTHRFIFEDTMTLRTEPAVQAILGGHEHDGRRHVINGKLVIKAQSNLRTVALVTFSQYRTSNGLVWQTRDTLMQIARGMSEEPKAKAIVEHWRDTLSRRIGNERVLGVAPVAIDATDSTSHSGESGFGDMVTDGIRIGTNADVALINSGGMRLDDMIGPGPVSSYILESVFLFADESRVVTFTLTGARLREVLEHGVSKGTLGAGGYPQVSGVRFTFDANLPSDKRIVGNVVRMDGSVIAPTDSVKVSFVTYPSCRNGDGYRIPEAAAACKELDADPTTKPRAVDLLIKHVESMQGRIVAPPSGRVTRIGKR